MKCPHALELITEVVSAVPPGHTATCADCQAALAALRLESGVAPRELLAAAQAELMRAPRGSSWRTLAALTAVSLVGVGVAGAVLAAAMRGGHSLSEPPPGVPSIASGALLLWLFALAVGALVAFGIAPGFAKTRSMVLGGGVGFGLFLALSGLRPGDEVPLLASSTCGALDLVVCALPFAVAVWASRRFAFDMVRVASLSAAAGLTGLVALSFHCQLGSLGHLLSFHAAPWFAGCVAAIAVRSRLRSESFAP